MVAHKMQFFFFFNLHVASLPHSIVALPWMGLEIFQEHRKVGRIVIGLKSMDQGMVNPGSSIFAGEWNRKSFLLLLMPSLSLGPLVSAPARVHCAHVDPVQLELQPAGPGEHVQGGLGHVGVRVTVALAHLFI